MTESEPEMVLVTVTCHTADCGNAGWAAELFVPPDPNPPNVTCGVCRQAIVDITGMPEPVPVPEPEPKG